MKILIAISSIVLFTGFSAAHANNNTQICALKETTVYEGYNYEVGTRPANDPSASGFSPIKNFSSPQRNADITGLYDSLNFIATLQSEKSCTGLQYFSDPRSQTRPHTLTGHLTCLIRIYSNYGLYQVFLKQNATTGIFISEVGTSELARDIVNHLQAVSACSGLEFLNIP